MWLGQEIQEVLQVLNTAAFETARLVDQDLSLGTNWGINGHTNQLIIMQSGSTIEPDLFTGTWETTVSTMTLRDSSNDGTAVYMITSDLDHMLDHTQLVMTEDGGQ